MPCIDRQRVADNTMRIINTHFDVNTAGPSLSTTYLLILQNMAAFSSAHSTLLSLDIIPLLHQVATLAVKDHNTGMWSARFTLLLLLLLLLQPLQVLVTITTSIIKTETTITTTYYILLLLLLLHCYYYYTRTLLL